MKIEVYNSIKQIKEDRWDSLVKENDLFASHKFIKTVEDADNNKEYKFWYVLVYDHDFLVGTSVFFRMSIDVNLLIGSKLREIIKLIKGIYKNSFVFQALICGLPVSVGKSNVRIAEKTNKRDVILALIAAEMTKIAIQERINFLIFKEFNEEETKYCDYLVSKGFNKVHSLGTNSLRIKWDSFEKYLQALRKYYRQSVLRSLRKMETKEVNVRIERNYENIYSPEIHRLYENVFNKAKFKLEKLSREFFVHINRHFGDSELMIFQVKGKIAGYVLIVYSPKIAMPLFLGIDYVNNSKYDIYFNLVSLIIKRTIEMKKEILDFGQSSYELKARMGAEVKPLFFYVKHLNSFVNFLLNMFSPLLFPKEKYNVKKVFKEK